MDKQPTKTTTKNKFLKLLPKAATIVKFQNPPFSPGRDNHNLNLNHHNNINNNYNTTHNFFRPKSHFGNHQKTYSGPIVSIIPNEARTRPRSKKKNGKTLDDDDEDDTPEPTSPKVSCIGQIKHHKHKHQNKKKNSFKKANPSTSSNNSINNNKPTKQFKSKSFSHKDGDNKIPRNSFKRMFAIGKLGKRSSDDIGVGARVGVSVSSSSTNVDNDIQRGGSGNMAVEAPALGQMKRFSGSRRRDAYGSFDWTAQIAPEEEEEEEDEDEEVIVPFSAPMVLGGGGEVDLKPRKEVNLWKRRTMAPPVPLRLHRQQKEKRS